MPSVAIELTTELAGRMCDFVHTAMIDGAGLIGESVGHSMMRSIIPIGYHGSVRSGVRHRHKPRLAAAIVGEIRQERANARANQVFAVGS
jgi:hypothetical protein